VDTNLPSPKLPALKRASLNETNLLTNIFSGAIAIGAVFLAVGSMTGTAQAQTAAYSTATVSYADLDLSTHDGARVLLKRINSAAKETCGPAPVMSPLTPAAPGHYDRCVEQAADKAVAQLNAPLVVALHAGAPVNADKTPVNDQFAAR
jgi:UrcA family protein